MRVGSRTLLRGTFQAPDEQNKGLMNVPTIHGSVVNSRAPSFDPGLKPCHTIAYERNVWEAYENE